MDFRPKKTTLTVLAVTLIGLAAAAAFAGGPAVLRGVVVDTEGIPLDGATVTVMAQGSDLPRAVKTNQKGKFGIRLPDVDLAYDVRFELHGYVSAAASIRLKPEDNPPLTVTLVAASQAAPQMSAPSTGEANETASGEPSPELSEARKAAVKVFNEGVVALEAGDLATALARFRQASVIDPEYENALNAVAVVALDVEDYVAAADASESLLRLQPDNLEAMSTAYYAELKVRDLERAIPAARRLATAKPEVVSEQMVADAEVLFGEYEYAGCRALLEVVIEMVPDFAPAYLQLGLTCNALPDIACAKKALETFLELAPDDPEAATARSLLAYIR